MRRCSPRRGFLRLSIPAALAIACAMPVLRAQTPDPQNTPQTAPAWAQPGSATHVQVAPPADFHRPSRNFDTAVGVFEGQSDIGAALVPGSASFDAGNRSSTPSTPPDTTSGTRATSSAILWKKHVGRRFAGRRHRFSRTPTATATARRSSSSARSLDDDAKAAMVALHGGGHGPPGVSVRRSDVRVQGYGISASAGRGGRPGGASAGQPRDHHGQAHRHREARRRVRNSS
jgi:hypothetical protein